MVSRNQLIMTVECHSNLWNTQASIFEMSGICGRLAIWYGRGPGMAATWRPTLPLQCLWSLRQRSANNTGKLGHSWFRSVFWVRPETWMNRGLLSSGKGEHKHLDLRRILDLWDLLVFLLFLLILVWTLPAICTGPRKLSPYSVQSYHSCIYCNQHSHQ